MVLTIRAEIGSCVVRFFAERNDASRNAIARESLSSEEHQIVEYDYGYLVKNVVNGSIYDDDGQLPSTIIESLGLAMAAKMEA